VKTTGINCGTTVALVWNAKFKTQPQANCDSGHLNGGRGNNINKQGGHSSGKPGKVRELKSGQGKVKENRKIRENELLQLLCCREYCSAKVSHIYNNSLLRPT